MHKDIPVVGALRGSLISEPETLITLVRLAAEQHEQLRSFLETNISEWLKGPKYDMIRMGHRYYENENDILLRERKVIGREGEMVAAPYLANNRLPHAFMRKLTKQKVNYLLAKPFTVSSDSEEFQEALAAYVTRAFRRLIKTTAQDAVIGGIGWAQPYYDAAGELHFKRIPATEVIPFWADIDHTVLDAAIRVYDVEVYESKEKKRVQYVKYYTKDKVYNFTLDEDGLHTLEDTPYEANFAFEREVELLNEETGESEVQTVQEGVMWDRIPLIPIKYNAEEDSLLKSIKHLIDDYDRRTSDLSNTLEDEPDRIKVVKDYDGTDKGEFMYNLARYRTLFLRGSGDIKTLDTSISVDALENHLTRTRRDIFEFGSGVDTQNKDLGNASAVALKFVYSDLDMDCFDFGNEIAWALEQMVWFIKRDLQLKTGVDYTDASFDVTFNTDITINETETISNIKNSVGIVSQKTLLEQHPYVDDASEEERLLEQEQQLAMERVEQEMAMQTENQIELQNAAAAARAAATPATGSGLPPTTSTGE